MVDIQEVQEVQEVRVKFHRLECVFCNGKYNRAIHGELEGINPSDKGFHYHPVKGKTLEELEDLYKAGRLQVVKYTKRQNGWWRTMD